MLHSVFAVACSVIGVRAMYEKEAGHYDYKLSLIGKPAGIVASPFSGASVLVTSVSGNLASVRADSGKVLWRLDNSANIDSLIDTGKGQIVVQSGNVLSVVEAASGIRKWSNKFEGLQKFALCSDSQSLKVEPQGTLVDIKTGGSETSSSSAKCDVYGVRPSLSVVQGVSASGYLLSGKRDDGTTWTRDESLALVDDVVIVGEDGNESQHDLAWLIGGWRIAAALSGQTHSVVLVDLASGTVKRSVAVDSRVVSLVKSGETKVNLLDRAGHVVGVLDPLTGVITKAPATEVKPTVSYRVNEQTGEIAGYLDANNILWQIALGAPIIRIVSQSHTEWGHVPVLVKGDASIVYNYLNPNLVVVLSGPSGSQGVTVSALDTVTGALVYQTVIPTASTAQKTLHFIACDNWIVGHYFNVESNRFEVISIDFFDKKEDKGFYAIATGQTASSAPESAYALPVDPIAISQQYVFPLGPVTAVAVTATRKGVTPRQVLFATNGGIYAVRKDTWLNPRRPGGPDVPRRLAVTSEESLPPYAAVLPVVATDLVAHVHVLSNIRRIVAVPTHLESTSLIAAFGDDIFVAPVVFGNAPYDVLSPFFNYWLLFVSLGVVVAATAITSVLATRKELYDKWK